MKLNEVFGVVEDDMDRFIRRARKLMFDFDLGDAEVSEMLMASGAKGFQAHHAIIAAKQLGPTLADDVA